MDTNLELIPFRKVLTFLQLVYSQTPYRALSRRHH
nr:MAG TPA: hypothetical protein [Bacteriophage sp.]